MNKLKELILITCAAWAFLMLTGIANADGNKTTFTDFVNAWAEVPGKVINHIKSEAEDIKAYQQDSWAEMKQKWPFKQNSAE